MNPDDIGTSKSDRRCCEGVLVCLSYLFLVITFPLSIWFCLITISQYEIGVVLRCGRLRENLAIRRTGLTFILPCVDQLIRIDMRTIAVNLPNQEVLTRDHVTIKLSAVISYRVRWPIRTIIKIAEVKQSTHWLSQAAVGQACGKRTLKDVLTEKDQMEVEILMTLEESTLQWGIQVEKATILEIGIPEEIQRSLAAKAEAERTARALVLAAEGELRSAAGIRAAADELVKSPVSIQLRLLQTLNTISAKNSDTVTFPLPMTMIRQIGQTYVKKIFDHHSGKQSQRQIMPNSEPKPSPSNPSTSKPKEPDENLPEKNSTLSVNDEQREPAAIQGAAPEEATVNKAVMDLQAFISIKMPTKNH